MQNPSTLYLDSAFAKVSKLRGAIFHEEISRDSILNEMTEILRTLNLHERELETDDE